MTNYKSITELRIEALEQIEEEVINILNFSGKCLSEISKDPTVDLNHRFNVERLVENTMATIKNVDIRLNEQISYLTQVSNIQPHEGSAYSSQIGAQTAMFRLEHVKNRLCNLERKQQHYLQLQQQQQQQQQQQRQKLQQQQQQEQLQHQQQKPKQQQEQQQSQQQQQQPKQEHTN